MLSFTKEAMDDTIVDQTKLRRRKMKILGIGICFAIILGAFFHTGPHLYLDINSAIFVLGGAIGFLVMKNKPENHLQNFGQGAVYFGWLGIVLGLIAITGTPSFIWGDVEKMGPALALTMQTVLYGYTLKLVTIALIED